MQVGLIQFEPVAKQYDLLASSTKNAIVGLSLEDVEVTSIDADLADTAAFCEHYGIGMDMSANCVIVEAKRADRVWYATCVILATTRADVNGIVRRYLDARKVSFAPMDQAVQLTGMEYGGITPIGLPGDWPILIDTQVANTPQVIIGSGVRSSKLLVPGSLLGALPNATVMGIVLA